MCKTCGAFWARIRKSRRENPIVILRPVAGWGIREISFSDVREKLVDLCIKVTDEGNTGEVCITFYNVAR